MSESDSSTNRCVRCLEEKVASEFDYVGQAVKSFCATCDQELQKLWAQRVKRTAAKSRRKGVKK